jgi:hypothetical protein
MTIKRDLNSASADNFARTVLSASRRTDIPAFYLDWFLSCLERGRFDVENPFSRKTRTLGFVPSDIHSIVFWSKNYAPLIESKIPLEDFNLFFHFTINSPVSLLEPGVPPLADRLTQASKLADWRGPDKLMWRFDPVVVWEKNGIRENNLSSFLNIAGEMTRIGVRRLTISVMDRYRKIDMRTRGLAGFEFIYAAAAESAELIRPYVEAALEMGSEVSLCCEKELLAILSPLPVKQGKCINGELLNDLFGPGADLTADRGQRRKNGCGCTLSFDVGSYASQPCRNNCLYCYANPQK